MTREKRFIFSNNRATRFLIAAGILVACGVSIAFGVNTAVKWIGAERDAAHVKRILAACEGTQDTQCAVNPVSDLLLTDGTGPAFRVVKELYPNFNSMSRSCFGFAERVGEKVAQRQTDYASIKFEPESVFCNFGFYQAYARTFLLLSGDISKTQKLCDHISSELGEITTGAADECYRGVGHALPFLVKDIQGDPVAMSAYAIKMCEELAPEGSQRGACISGLFSRMGYAQQKNLYGLEVDTKDPLSLCRKQPQKYFRRCENNFKRSIMGSSIPHDLDAGLDLIQKMYPALSKQDLEAVAFTIGYDSASDAMPDPDFDALAQSCLRRNGSLQEQCISGTATGIAKMGVPGDQDIQVFEFCNAVTRKKGEKSQSCPSDVALLYMKSFFTTRKYAEICEKFGLTQSECNVSER